VADRSLRFKIDENLPEEVARMLRAAGYDAIATGAEGLSGAPDARLAAVVIEERRALVTLDLDFADIRAYPPERYPGMIVLRVRRQDIAHICSVTERLIPLLRAEPLEGRLWVVDETTVRIRGGES
jgi:predicted nuclease of predicted toxin-antitoxin system